MGVLIAGLALVLVLPACKPDGSSTGPGGWSTIAALPAAGPTSGGTHEVAVTLGETSPTEMYIHLSSEVATEGKVTFTVTNEGTETHEFVVLATDTAAGDLPIVSFEGEKDRIDEEAPGVTNVGETGDMEPGATKTLVIDMAPGHYAVVCNLPGHYRMGMHQDFTVTPVSDGTHEVAVTLGETSPTEMYIHLSSEVATEGKVTFTVTNEGTETHEFVVLATDTAAGDLPIVSFEGEKDRIDEEAPGVTNVGETGDMEPGATKTLVIDMAPGHYAVVCNLPGHYRMGMHQDFTVTPVSDGTQEVAVTLGETSPTEMYIHLSSEVATEGKVTFTVTNEGTETHEFVVLATDTAAGDLPIVSFEGEKDRIDEEAPGVTNVGETGDMEPGATKTLVIDMAPGHYAVVCNLPGHYRMGMHQDFTVTPVSDGTQEVAVTLGETSPTEMYIHLSSEVATEGKVTFTVTNEGTETHEFVVLATDTAAGDLPIVSFEGEKDRIDEEAPGVTNVGETGDMEPGATKTLVIDMAPGHYAVVCNLPGHYRMGMHQDFTVTPVSDGTQEVAVTLGETSPTEMYIHLSSEVATEGKVTFTVTNEGTETHEFVVLATDTAAGDLPIVSFEGEKDRIDEEAPGVTNVGETGDMEPGATKTLVIDMAPGHYAVVCNLPGHYRMGMHQDFTVTPVSDGTQEVAVTLGETSPTEMYIHLSSEVATEGKVTFTVTNEGTETHEFVVLATDTAAGDLPIVSFEGEKDRIDEEAPGVTNVGETGDMEPGATKTLVIDMAPGHYAVVCNLPGHYRMGMHQDFTVTPVSDGTQEVAVTLGETSPTEMYIHLSSEVATEGKVTFTVTNEGTETHEFVVLATDTAAGDLPIVSFEGEKDRIDEEAPGVTNVGETGDMEPGATKTLVIDMAPGHYAVVCNLPGHYRMGMHQDFTVTPA